MIKTRSKNKRDILKCRFFGNNHHFNEIFSKCGQNRNKASKISEEEVKFYHKFSQVVKFISKSTISLKCNAGERQSLHNTS